MVGSIAFGLGAAGAAEEFGRVEQEQSSRAAGQRTARRQLRQDVLSGITTAGENLGTFLKRAQTLKSLPVEERPGGQSDAQIDQAVQQVRQRTVGAARTLARMGAMGGVDPASFQGALAQLDSAGTFAIGPLAEGSLAGRAEAARTTARGRAIAGAGLSADELQQAGQPLSLEDELLFTAKQAEAQRIGGEVPLDRVQAEAEARAAGTAAGTPVAPAGFQTSLGKTIQDHQKAIELFGADSEQAAAFDEVLEAEQLGERPGFKDIRSVRQEFTKLSGEFIDSQNSYGTILASAENPDAAGDLALIFSYMRLLDPASTVREGEFATAQNTAGVPDQVRNFYNRLLTGERLNDAQRAQFVGRAGGIFAERLRGHVQLEERFRTLSASSDLPPDQVVIDFKRDFADAASDVPEAASGLEINGKPIATMTEQEIKAIDPNTLSIEQAQALLDQLRLVRQGQP